MVAPGVVDGLELVDVDDAEGQWLVFQRGLADQVLCFTPQPDLVEQARGAVLADQILVDADLGRAVGQLRLEHARAGVGQDGIEAIAQRAPGQGVVRAALQQHDFAHRIGLDILLQYARQRVHAQVVAVGDQDQVGLQFLDAQVQCRWVGMVADIDALIAQRGVIQTAGQAKRDQCDGVAPLALHEQVEQLVDQHIVGDRLFGIRQAMAVDQPLLQQEAAALAARLQVHVAVARRQARQQFTQHQRLARILQVGLHIVQGVEVDHEQAVAAIGIDSGDILRQLAEEADIEIVFVRVQQQLCPVVLDEETLAEIQNSMAVQ